MARILLKKNQNYPKELDDLNSLKQKLSKEQARYSVASKTEKAKIKPGITAMDSQIDSLQGVIKVADSEIDKAFKEYAKVLELRPDDRYLLSEIATNYYNFRRYEGAARYMDENARSHTGQY